MYKTVFLADQGKSEKKGERKGDSAGNKDAQMQISRLVKRQSKSGGWKEELGGRCGLPCNLFD